MEKSILYAKITVSKKIVSKLSFILLYRSFIFIVTIMPQIPINPLLHAIRNNGIRFFSFWNSKENVSNKVIPKKKILICCE